MSKFKIVFMDLWFHRKPFTQVIPDNIDFDGFKIKNFSLLIITSFGNRKYVYESSKTVTVLIRIVYIRSSIWICVF